LSIIEATALPEALNLPEGQLILVDKPLRWTSFDVVNKVRFAAKNAYGLKKLKVGHAGTLDPLATGLLLICTGPYTKKLGALTGLDKTYTGTFLLGKTTPSFDLETDPDDTFPVAHITHESAIEAAAKMTGKQAQMPPMFSAKKIEGQKAYIAARKGETIELKPREIVIHEFSITRFELPEVDFEIRCSTGTYIRAIARDFGKMLDSGACLSALRRTETGPYSVENAFNLDELIALLAATKRPL
jgi:tRNA pseudouridine55 synthase